MIESWSPSSRRRSIISWRWHCHIIVISFLFMFRVWCYRIHIIRRNRMIELLLFGLCTSWIRGPTTSKLGRTFGGSKKILSPFSLRFSEIKSLFKCLIKDLSDIPFMSTTCPSSIIWRSYNINKDFPKEKTKSVQTEEFHIF